MPIILKARLLLKQSSILKGGTKFRFMSRYFVVLQRKIPPPQKKKVSNACYLIGSSLEGQTIVMPTQSLLSASESVII